MIKTLSAQTLTEVPAEYSDPTSSTFRIVICDGPALPPDLLAEATKSGRYIPCDFKGMIMQIQHLINIMIIIGVLASIGAFTYAGVLYMSGSPEKKKQAHSIFPKILTGFIIMLTAWFIVYQILSWLGRDELKALLGNPT